MWSLEYCKYSVTCTLRMHIFLCYSMLKYVAYLVWSWDYLDYEISLIFTGTLQLCFLRQFKVSIKRSDYLALRLGFVTVSTPNMFLLLLLFLCVKMLTICQFPSLWFACLPFRCQYHKLPHSYDFHKYMVRSMEEWLQWVYWYQVIELAHFSPTEERHHSRIIYNLQSSLVNIYLLD